jgi:hypothetical protein
MAVCGPSLRSMRDVEYGLAAISLACAGHQLARLVCYGGVADRWIYLHNKPKIHMHAYSSTCMPDFIFLPNTMHKYLTGPLVQNRVEQYYLNSLVSSDFHFD